MRRLCVFLLLVASPVSAQQNPAQPRFRSSAEVIAIDVTVVEQDGTPVADLTAEDFTVTVEGRRRAIQSAQFLRADPGARAPRPDESSNTDASSGRLLLIVTDDATLRPGSQAVVGAAAALLDRLGPGDLAGIAHIPDGGGVPFTTDRARLIHELERIRPATPQFRSDASIYISEALDHDGAQRVQWPAAVTRECGAEADSPVFRLCLVNLQQAARTLVIDESIKTNATARGLERLMKSLAPTGRPVTVVLISESMVIARDPSALAGIAEACAEARVSLHVVQPAPPTAEMNARGFPSDPLTDAQLRAEGLELMAARARGAFHRVVSTGASTFEQIGRETSGYYLLGIEPAPEDRREPRRRVDVSVRRPGVTVRARSMFALDAKPAETPADMTTRLRLLLEGPVPERGVPLRMTARTVSGTGGQVRVLIAAEVGEPTDQQARYHLGLIAIDREGSVKARTAATTVLSPARAGRQSPSLFTTSLLLDPGDYSVRLAAIDQTGRSGSVHHGIRASLRQWPRGFRTSDLVVANQPAASEFPPFNASSIVETADVAAVIEVMHDNAAAVNDVTVRFELDGEVVESRAQPATSAGRPAVRSFASLLGITGAGEHRLRAMISVPGAEAIAVERTFSYDPPSADPLDPGVTRRFIETLEGQVPVSPALATFVARAKGGEFVKPPDADARPDGDIAMVTFVGGLAALRDQKPALARVLFQQTLRKAPGFEGALFYLAQLK